MHVSKEFPTYGYSEFEVKNFHFQVFNQHQDKYVRVQRQV